MEWRDRVAALEPLGWSGRDAEWVALVCLYSGVFLRAQYLAFIGQQNPGRANWFVKRLGKTAVEELWNGSGVRVCRIAGRPMYAAVGAENVRHRKRAKRGVLLRRLLSLDYVLEHPGEPWLATEEEKVAALTACGIPEDVLPRRVYAGARSQSGRVRYFVHKVPVALDNERAKFVFTLAEDATPSAVRTWGEGNARLWAALLASGRVVEVVVAGQDPERLAAAGRVLERWMENRSAKPAGPAGAAAELTELRAGVAALDAEVMGRYGGLNESLARMAELEAAAAAEASAPPPPAISTGRIWRSVRVPE